MKLSEAVREGSKDKKQLRHEGDYVKWSKDFSQIISVSAFGAIVLAVLGAIEPDRSIGKGLLFILDKWPHLCSLYPELLGWYEYPGEWRKRVYPTRRLDYVINDLNDHEGWTFDQIADWLEGVGL